MQPLAAIYAEGCADQLWWAFMVHSHR